MVALGHLNLPSRRSAPAASQFVGTNQAKIVTHFVRGRKPDVSTEVLYRVIHHAVAGDGVD